MNKLPTYQEGNDLYYSFISLNNYNPDGSDLLLTPFDDYWEAVKYAVNSKEDKS